MKAVAVGLVLCAVMMASSVSVGASSESCKTCSQVATEFIANYSKDLNETKLAQTYCTKPLFVTPEFCRSNIYKLVSHYVSGIQTSNASYLCAAISTCPVSLTECATCQFALVAFRDFMTSSNAKKNAKSVVHSICKVVPADLRILLCISSGIEDPYPIVDILADLWKLYFSKTLWWCKLSSVCQ